MKAPRSREFLQAPPEVKEALREYWKREKQAQRARQRLIKEVL